MKYMYLFVMVVFIAGCATTEISTNGSGDGDITEDSEEVDGDASEEDGDLTESSEESDGDTSEEDGDYTEDVEEETEDSEDESDGDSTEVEETEWCHTAPASCEEIQGTCPEGQACVMYIGGSTQCLEWLENEDYSEWAVPTDTPECQDEDENPDPDKYARCLTSWIDRIEHWTKSCTNDNRECKESDGYCCEYETGFWYPINFIALDTDSIVGICDANHNVIFNVKPGYCWIDDGDRVPAGDELYEDHDFMDNSHCTYCNPEINQYAATNVPAGEDCSYIEDNHPRAGICDGDGTCIPKY